jgi:hypothetical protein
MPTGRVRNISSIANRTNNCGGPKKAGLAPRTGGNALVMRNIATQGVNTIPVVKCGSGGRGCPRNFSNNPGGQACGGVGRMAQLATRGIVPPGGRSRGGGVPRETITLATAEAQNGVRANQDLVLRTDDYEQDGNNVYGLQIRNNKTFTLAAGGTITFADPIAAAGAADGIRVETGGTFTQQGGAITFEGAITGAGGDGDATGIYNDNGTFRQEGGAITFRGDITGTGDFAEGIFNNTGTFTQTAGAITFEGAISNTGDATGIYNEATGTFTQAGTITFRGAITSTGGQATGISTGLGTFSQQVGGTITFESELVGTTAVRLVRATNANIGSFAVNGAIAFPGTTYVPANFFPNLQDDRFTGTGTITYNNDNEPPNIYYQDL